MFANWYFKPPDSRALKKLKRDYIFSKNPPPLTLTLCYFTQKLCMSAWSGNIFFAEIGKKNSKNCLGCPIFPPDHQNS